MMRKNKLLDKELVLHFGFVQHFLHLMLEVHLGYFYKERLNMIVLFLGMQNWPLFTGQAPLPPKGLREKSNKV